MKDLDSGSQSEADRQNNPACPSVMENIQPLSKLIVSRHLYNIVFCIVIFTLILLVAFFFQPWPEWLGNLISLLLLYVEYKVYDCKYI